MTKLKMVFIVLVSAAIFTSATLETGECKVLEGAPKGTVSADNWIGKSLPSYMTNLLPSMFHYPFFRHDFQDKTAAQMMVICVTSDPEEITNYNRVITKYIQIISMIY